MRTRRPCGRPTCHLTIACHHVRGAAAPVDVCCQHGERSDQTGQ